MKLKYLSTIEEFAEAHFRQYFRGNNFSRNRNLSSLFFTISVTVGLLFFILVSTGMFPPVILLSPILIIGAYYYYRYPSLIRRRIEKQIKRDLKDNLPCETSYTIEENQIIVQSLEVKITFQLRNLREIKQDEIFIELYFGPKGLCLIPKRVFNTSNELDVFLNKIKSEQPSPADTGISA